MLESGMKLDLISYIRSCLNHVIDKKIYIEDRSDISAIERKFISSNEIVHKQFLHIENDPNYIARYLSSIFKNIYYKAINITSVKDVLDGINVSFL